eukprot:gene3474-2425_t
MNTITICQTTINLQKLISYLSYKKVTPQLATHCIQIKADSKRHCNQYKSKHLLINPT